MRYVAWVKTGFGVTFTIQQVVEALKKEQVVCFPTDTLYALACSAFSTNAVQRLYEIKRRQHHKPIPLLLSSSAMLREFSSLRDEDWAIIERLSSKPVTFVVPLHHTGRLPHRFFNGTVGVRVPNHAKALAILQEFGAPVAATSANLSGMPNARCASDIPQEILDRVSAFIEDDSEVSGTCSTVFDLQSRKVFRPGMLSERRITRVVESCGKI
ncbi:L-threonylcarbamoyladenylate synthase [Anaplasma capra]|uniref:L-threonylcarbamoyladenylate synthase n=1 Tax=Anaplasma capra TaxID=1562740 RepID=UPI0021D5EA35|nr:L-threonylcarbamoyladenylate synthase [Anaplasma capra]MCU7611443.1 L-threonylcarbamoyladenylate synthase [Anaplasma capra]MCU7612118.1 L-threonylcarbamoyladenylate synthase [Anaplasma capra]